MTPRTSLIPPVIVVTVSLLSFAFAQTSGTNSPQAESELRAVRAQLGEAIQSGDDAKVRSFYAPNFIMRLRNGKVLTLDDLNQLNGIGEKPPVTERKVLTVIQKLKLTGTGALLTVEHNVDTRYKLGDGSIRRVVEITQEDERWTREGNEWKMSMIENLEQRRREVTLNGQKDNEFIPGHAPAIDPTPDDQAVVKDGYGIVFIYRMKDNAVIKPPIYCNEQKVAQMTGGSFLKLKLRPGRYSFKSDKGDPIDVNVELSKISFLTLKLESGFPKGRGRLQLDSSIIAAEAYKLPHLLDLTPLGSDNINDPTKVISR